MRERNFRLSFVEETGQKPTEVWVKPQIFQVGVEG